MSSHVCSLPAMGKEPFRNAAVPCPLTFRFLRSYLEEYLRYMATQHAQTLVGVNC
jgi:hypothetical protein